MRNAIKSLVLAAVFVAASAPAQAWTLAVDRAMAHAYIAACSTHWNLGHPGLAKVYLSYAWNHIYDARVHYGLGSIVAQAVEYSKAYNTIY
jgi:hypothetical protein